VSARTKGRKRAVDALYAAQLRDAMASDLLEEAESSVSERENQEPIFNFAKEIVHGVLLHQTDIDEMISSLAQNWTIERMPAVDLAILRVGCFEIAFATSTPTEVAISEAVNLARELSTEESPAFINGILSAIAATRKPI